MKLQQRFPLTERNADDVIACRAAGPVRVRELIAEATSLAHRLPDHRYVFNLHTDRYEYLRTFCAAVIAEQCTLMPPNRQPATLAQIAERYADCYSVGGDEVTSNAEPNSNAPDARIPAIPENLLCAIAFTSGSTSVPQPHRKYWRTFRAGSLSNKRLLTGNPSETVYTVATVPAQHMWGMEMAVLMPLFANIAISHRAPFFPQDIANATMAIPAPRALVSTPIHLQTLLKSEVQTAPLSTIYTATAPLSKSLAAALEKNFKARVTEVFGCTEAGILAVRHSASETLWKLADAFQLRVEEDGMQILADHLPGKVTMPDIVELTEDRRFRWIGRQHDMINIGGKRGSLADLNRRLRDIPGVSDGIVFMPEGRKERLAALVVAPELAVSDILDKLKLEVEPLFLPRPLYKVSELPRQETGKLAIGAVRELFEQSRKLQT